MCLSLVISSLQSGLTRFLLIVRPQEVHQRSTAGHVVLPVMGFVAIGYLGGEQGQALIIGILVFKCADNVLDVIV